MNLIKSCFFSALTSLVGQLISKQKFWAITSPKKRSKHTQESILNSFRSFFGDYPKFVSSGRSYSWTILFRDLLTVSTTHHCVCGSQNVRKLLMLSPYFIFLWAVPVNCIDQFAHYCIKIRNGCLSTNHHRVSASHVVRKLRSLSPSFSLHHRGDITESSLMYLCSFSVISFTLLAKEYIE